MFSCRTFYLRAETALLALLKTYPRCTLYLYFTENKNRCPDGPYVEDIEVAYNIYEPFWVVKIIGPEDEITMMTAVHSMMSADPGQPARHHFRRVC